MSVFSASDAALEGFQVLRRHWRVVAGWAGFNLLAMIAMVIVTVIVALVSSAMTGGGPNAPSNVAGVLGGGVALVGTALIEVVMMAGLYRLMLRPDEPAFLHLRLGRDEMRLSGLVLILGLGAVALMFAGVGLGEIAGRRSIALEVAVIGVTVIVVVALILRFLVAGPATFERGHIALATSWRLTRGHLLALFGMMLLVACVTALIAVVLWLVLILTIGAMTGFRGLMGAMMGRGGPPGLYLAQVAVQLIVAPVLGVITQAPAVAVYRALSGRGGEA